MRAAVLLFLLASSCGIDHKVKGDADLNVQGRVTHEVDVSALLLYFEAFCKSTLPPEATPQEINDCALAEFYKFTETL